MSIGSVGNGKRGSALLSTVEETMADLKVGRAKLYELINSGELESFTEGRSRKILEESKQAYVQRRLEAERLRRARRAKGADATAA
jgi:hypothetical protein